MKITSIKTKKIESSDNSRLLGVASIIFDNEFIVTDIKIIRGENRIFLAMPSAKMPDGTYRDLVYPINNECRQKIETEVLREFDKYLDSLNS